MKGYELDCVEVVIAERSKLIDATIDEMQEVGLSRVMLTLVPRSVSKPEDLEDRKMVVVGVGKQQRELRLAPGPARKMKALAFHARDAQTLRKLAIDIGGQTPWQHRSCALTELPELLPYLDDRVGRWYVCYAEQSVPLPENVTLVRPDHHHH